MWGTEAESFELRQNCLGLRHGHRLKGRGNSRGGLGPRSRLSSWPRVSSHWLRSLLPGPGLAPPERAAESQWKEPMRLSYVLFHFSYFSVLDYVKH